LLLLLPEFSFLNGPQDLTTLLPPMQDASLRHHTCVWSVVSVAGLSPVQVTAIKNMEMTQEQMTALMDKLGIDPGQFGGGRMANLTESERATQIAQFQAQGGNFTPRDGQMPSGGSSGSGGRTFTGGQPPSGGMTFSGGGPGMDPGVTGGTGTGTQSTQTAGSTQRRMGGMDRMFLDPLIKILEERAGS